MLKFFVKLFYMICTILVFFFSQAVSGQLNSQNRMSTEEFDQRAENLYDEMLEMPFVAGKMHTYDEKILSRAYTCSKACFAIVNFYKNKDIEQADDQILEICKYYKNHPEDTSYEHDSNAWAGSLFVRIIKLFGSNGQYPGRLDIDVENQLLELMWDWANVHSDISITQYDQSSEWRIEDSENHDAQRFMPCWGFAMIFKDHPGFKDRTYTHGGTVLDHYNAWTGYFKEYLAERAKRGLFVEMANNLYSLHTLKGIYDMYDFSTDVTLKNRACMLLDLFWATWAEEQLNGIRGGSKARLYPCFTPYGNYDVIRDLGWYYFGTGFASKVVWDNINVGYVGLLCAVTSTYRPHKIISEIITNPAENVYEIKQRRMGLAKKGYYRPPDYRLSTDFGGIFRYSYKTPAYIIGTSMFEALAHEDWTLISSQNRWCGVIFSGHPHARIFPQCKSLVGNRTYNQYWAVQKYGTLIVQKLKTSFEAGDMRVWFASKGLDNRQEEDGWIFAEAKGAYVAIRPADGGYKWDIENNRKSNWLKCINEYSPLIIQVVQKNDFDNYSDFKSAIRSLSLSFNKDILLFTGLSGDRFKIYADYSALPEINSKTINLQPDKVFDSPFIQAGWGDGIVEIKNGNHKIELDFVEVN